jgi:predicted nuclease of predicted toxin-antitoxin system
MKPQIVADESVDFRIVSLLRQEGFSVLAIIELMPSITDKAVLDVACDNEALLITEDKDFGELVFRFKLPHPGILLIRVEEKEDGIPWVVRAIQKYYPKMLGKFCVISDKRLRIKDPV